VNGSEKLRGRTRSHAIFDPMSGERHSAEEVREPENSVRRFGVFEAVRSLPPRAFAVGGIAVWCFIVMAVALNLAISPVHWVAVFVFGALLPVLLTTYANHAISSLEAPALSKPEDKENELLEVLGERGELTPTLAAMKTSLTVEEASEMLRELAGMGYLEMRGEDGVIAYSLWERDLRDVRSEAVRSEAREIIEKPPSARSEGGVPVAHMSESLSERELEVLTLLASGKPNREIAKDLFVAEGTVKTHTNNIYRKIGAKNRAEALAKARDLRLL
jgi:DNA-binding CsgD family transcriptional regulator